MATTMPARNPTQISLCVRVRSRSRWPGGLRRGSAVASLLVLRVRVPPGVWMSGSCDCCVLSGRSLCDWLIPHLEGLYRVYLSVIWKPRTKGGLGPPGLSSHKKKFCVCVCVCRYTCIHIGLYCVFLRAP